jgi:hypothetical protein
MILGFWGGDMFPQLGFLFVLAIITIARFVSEDRKKALAYGALAIGGIGATYMARLHMYGWINVLIPAHAVLALLAVLLFTRLEYAKDAEILLLASLLMVVQMGVLLYDPLPFIPGKNAVEQGNRFLEEIAKIPGDIFMPDLQFVQTRVGKKSYAFGMAGYDILRADLGDKGYVSGDLEGQLEDAISSRKFAAIMSGSLLPLPGLEDNYKFYVHLEYPREFVTGAINFLTTDLFIPIPNDDDDDKKGATNTFDKSPPAADDPVKRYLLMENQH